MFGTVACDPSGKYLASLGNILSQLIYVLVIYLFNLVLAKDTNLFP